MKRNGAIVLPQSTPAVISNIVVSPPGDMIMDLVSRYTIMMKCITSKGIP